MQLFHPGTQTYLARYPKLLPNGDWQFMHAAGGGPSGFNISGANGMDRVLGWAKEEAPYARARQQLRQPSAVQRGEACVKPNSGKPNCFASMQRSWCRQLAHTHALRSEAASACGERSRRHT